ncbi:hypothetical protein KI387_022858, partial [Taxus chinensis]
EALLVLLCSSVVTWLLLVGMLYPCPGKNGKNSLVSLSRWSTYGHFSKIFSENNGDQLTTQSEPFVY